MRLAVINLNKRLGNPVARGNFQQWLEQNDIDLLLAQEPARRVGPLRLKGYRSLGGTPRTFAWARTGLKIRFKVSREEFFQKITDGNFDIYNVYLNACSRKSRREQLLQIQSLVREKEQRTIITGDFNLAPRPRDGLYGSQYSDFNGRTDRDPFLNLLKKGLKDLGAHDNQYTFERVTNGKMIRFRCDLCLIPERIDGRITFHHETRHGVSSFTDHSGLVVTIQQ